MFVVYTVFFLNAAVPTTLNWFIGMHFLQLCQFDLQQQAWQLAHMHSQLNETELYW